MLGCHSAPGHDDGYASRQNTPVQLANNQEVQAAISCCDHALSGPNCHSAGITGYIDTNIPRSADVESNTLGRDRPFIERFQQSIPISSELDSTQPSGRTAPNHHVLTDSTSWSASSRYDWRRVHDYIVDNYRSLTYAELVEKLRQEYNFTVT